MQHLAQDQIDETQPFDHEVGFKPFSMNGRGPHLDLMRVTDRIRTLSKNPRPTGREKLSDREQYRIRQDDYRIVYEIDDEQQSIHAVKIGNHKEVYRNKQHIRLTPLASPPSTRTHYLATTRSMFSPPFVLPSPHGYQNSAASTY